MPDEDEEAVLDADKVVWREVGDDIVILEVSTATYLTLNGSAGVLWRCLEGGSTREGLITALAERYRIPRARAKDDVSTFLAALEDRALLIRNNVSPGG